MSAAKEQARIDPGAEVIASDGQRLGTVDFVVVHPPEMHVNDLVVSTGAILGRDVVVPVDSVKSVSEGKVYLSIDKAAAEKLPDYIEVHYETPPVEWTPPTGFDYPAGSILWPASTYYPQESEVKVNAPKDTVGIHSGMSVKSSDGHRVGSVRGLDEDPGSGNLTDIVMKQGFLFTHDVRIPVDQVAEIADDVVNLKLSRSEVKNLGKS